MNTKLAAVVAVVVVAVGVLAWQGFSQLGPRPVRSAQSADRGDGPSFGPGELDDVEVGPDGEPMLPEGGRRVEMGGPSGPAPAWITDAPDSKIDGYEFPKSGEAAAALDQAPTILAAKFDGDETMSAVSDRGRLDAVESWLAFMRPLVTGDEQAFASSVAKLGGLTEPNEEGDAPANGLFGRLSPLFESSPIALDQASIRTADASDRQDVPRMMEIPGMKIPKGAALMMMMQFESIDEETGESTNREALSIPLQNLFPRAGEAAKNGAKVVEVWTPAKVKGSGGNDPDLGTSVFLVWNSKENAWQPVAMRVTFLSTKGREKLNLGG